MNLHLFSMPGAYPLQDIVATSKPYLVAQDNPVILYLPASETSLNPEYVDITRTAFSNFAKVETLDLTQPIQLVDIESILDQASVLYIPGGNTYLLLDRLYRSKVFSLIQERVQTGMPLVGFSAGMIICGENILTSNDTNNCASTNFAGLGFTKYNFAAHYPADVIEMSMQSDRRICEYHKSHANPVLALEDDGCVEIDIEGIKVVRGHCWLFEVDTEKVLLGQGYIG